MSAVRSILLSVAHKAFFKSNYHIVQYIAISYNILVHSM